jgi:hypothetical protein
VRALGSIAGVLLALVMTLVMIAMLLLQMIR